MIHNLAAVVAGTIWDTGPHAVVLALLPLVVWVAGLVLCEPESRRQSAIQWVREINPVAHPAGAGTLGHKHQTLPLRDVMRALGSALKGGTR